MSTRTKRRTRVAILWVAASFAFAHACFWFLPRVFEPWNAQTIDRFFVLRSGFERFRPAYDGRVAHIDINNTSIQQLNNFYLNRSHFARVIRNLAAVETAVQVYDFIFPALTNEADDRAMISATKEAGNVYFGMALALSPRPSAQQRQPPGQEVESYLRKTSWHVRVQGDPSGIPEGSSPLLTFTQLASVSRGLGFLTMKPDSDGVFRRVPLLLRYEEAYYPSMAFRVVCDVLAVPPEKILVKPGESITLEGARFPGGSVRDVVIPTDREGNMVVNFLGSWERMVHYNFADVYGASRDQDELDVWREELRGRIILISDVSTGSTDIGTVPTDINFPLSGLHANVIHNITTGQFLRELTLSEVLPFELFLAAGVLLLSIRFSPLVFITGTMLLGVGYLAFSVYLFLGLQLIPHVVRPLFLLVLSTIALTAYRYFDEEKEKEVLRKTFEAYFPPSVVRKLMANPGMLSLKGQKKELTVLFSDIKGFTSSSANLAPDQVQRYLNEYFEEMVEIVFGHQGTVDKYIGDGLMVFFGDPEPQKDHALRCVRAAVDMQRKARELDARWQKEGGIPIVIRIGINTGEVLVGNMGSLKRLSYTVLGSAVNMAQRLEANAPPGGILISKETHAHVKDQIHTRPLGEIRVKGIEEPVTVFEVPVDEAGPGSSLS